MSEADADTGADPTQAVALRYDAPGAPRVVAKGRGEVGRAILAAAREYGVELRCDPALAEALAQVELDDQIPEALYRAVATVIAFVLRSRPPAGGVRGQKDQCGARVAKV